MSRRKQSVRLYLDADDYRELLKQAAETESLRTPSDYAAGLLAEALRQAKAGESSHD